MITQDDIIYYELIKKIMIEKMTTLPYLRKLKKMNVDTEKVNK